MGLCDSAYGCFDRSIMLSGFAIQVLSHVVLLYLFVLKRGLISSMLECAWMSRLARYSLSIYLTHWMFYKTVRTYVEQTSPRWLQDHVALSITAAIVGSYVVGVLAHHLVEKTCTRYLTRFFAWMKEGSLCKEPQK